jgi:peptidyl-prolyl cis-trans isomerase A (cyclophilin A)
MLMERRKPERKAAARPASPARTRPKGHRARIPGLVLAIFHLGLPGMLGAQTGAATTVVTVRIDTEMGSIQAELYPDRAPLTVANFLRYLEEGAYDDGIFHRSVRDDNQPGDSIRIRVIQGGPDPAWNPDAGDLPAPVPLERTSVTGLRHLEGTLSMARSSPDSARSSFFICIDDEPELDFGGRRNPDGQGFAAFGRVTEGMDVVRAIHRAPVQEQALTPPLRIFRVVRTDG